MDYLKRYHLIATAMLDFEKAGCDYYHCLSEHPAVDAIAGRLRQIACNKARELDIFAGMLTICDFLLTDYTRKYDMRETSDWLKANTPDLYHQDSAQWIIQARRPAQALGIVIDMEEIVLKFYREIRKKIPMNIGQIDAVVTRQQTEIAGLRDLRERLRNDDCRMQEPVGALVGQTREGYSA